MCCIFTCCGWMIDLIQRLWTFTMACCISSAVCCALVTASMSGIALGYNYSLAEYIDLKETNVSVYLKRGVFDDEIADDMDWRRSGHMPVQGHLKESNLVTGGLAGPEEMPLRSGRRMDDSLVMSDDKHKFEGSLMRLTAKPPDGRRMGDGLDASPEPVTSDSQMAEIITKYPMGSLEQMKAIHGLLNMRSGQRNTVLPPTQPQLAQGHEIDGRRVMPMNQQPGNMNPMDYGPVMSDAYKKFNPARFAVPDESVRDPANWVLPKNNIPNSLKRTMVDVVDYENIPSSRATRPQPIRFSTEVQRPTKTRPEPTHTEKSDNIHSSKDTAILESPLDRFKNKIMMERMDLPGLGKDYRKDQFKDQFKEPPMSKELLSEDDYEEEANKGLPIRKKRNKRNAMNGEINTPVGKFLNGHLNLNESNDSKITKSVLITKIISSTKCGSPESSEDKLVKSSIQPPSFLKSISRFLSLL